MTGADTENGGGGGEGEILQVGAHNTAESRKYES